MTPYSVLTTVYKKDNPAFLKQSVDSILSQTVLTDDYVIVADGPLTDELEKVLAGYVDSFPFIHIVRLSENKGLGFALQTGVQKCKNELIARLDSDDIATPDRCELQLKEFSDDPELAVVGSDIYEFDETPEVIKDLKRMPSGAEQIYRYGKRRNPFNHSTVMYRKSVVLAVGNYSDMRRSQDLELWAKIIYRGYKCKNINKPLVYFRTDGTERIKRKRKWSNVKSDLKIFKANYKMGYAGLFDYLYVVTYQTVFFLLPEKIAGKLYMMLFRSKAKVE